MWNRFSPFLSFMNLNVGPWVMSEHFALLNRLLDLMAQGLKKKKKKPTWLRVRELKEKKKAVKKKNNNRKLREVVFFNHYFCLYTLVLCRQQNRMGVNAYDLSKFRKGDQRVTVLALALKH